MPNLTNPFDAILQQAAKLPQSRSLEPYVRRLNTETMLVSVIVLDVSGSMAEIVESGQRKIDLLRSSVDRPLQEWEVAIAFGSSATRIYNLQDIPQPVGSTALDLAIATAIPFNPGQTLVISDGKPDNPELALNTAKKLSGIINTLYIGLDKDTEAIAFMRSLARVGCGRAQECDISKNLQALLLRSKIQNLLRG